MSALDRWNKLEPRERTLLTALGGIVFALAFIVVPLMLYRSVGKTRDENQEIKDFIQTVRESRDKIDQKKASRDAMLAKYQKTIPASFVEDAAKQNNVDIAETQKKPDVPHGKKYVEHLSVLKMRKVGLFGLAKMMEKIARGGYPVAITKMNLKPRAGEPDSYDVEMSVSSFERKGEPKKDKPEEPVGDESADDGE
jgi:general secretion pathway protein M